jgi:hypothetical protein
MRTRNKDSPKPATAKKTPPPRKSASKTPPNPPDSAAVSDTPKSTAVSDTPKSTAVSDTPKSAETKRPSATKAKPVNKNDAATPPSAGSDSKPQQSLGNYQTLLISLVD